MAGSYYDRLLSALNTIVTSLTKQVEFHALYLGVVVQVTSASNGDGTSRSLVDIQPVYLQQAVLLSMANILDYSSDPTKPQLRMVPLVTLMGQQIVPTPNSFILYGFMNGDPNLPYATPFQAPTCASYKLSSSGPVSVNGQSVNINDGTLAAARKTDGVGVSLTAAQIGLLAAQIVAPGGPGGPCTAPAATGLTGISGTINGTCSTTVKIG